MRVDEFRAVIIEIRDVLDATGQQDMSACLGELFEELEKAEPADIEDMVKRLRAAVDMMGMPPAARYSARLANIGYDETAFNMLMGEIANDHSLKKPDLQTILRSYTGRFDKKAPLGQLKEDLKRAFYTKLYDRDAQVMANRATPL